jgi:hypothetical protein
MEIAQTLITSQGRVNYSIGVNSIAEQDGEYRAWLTTCIRRFNKRDWGDTDQEGVARILHDLEYNNDIKARYNNPRGDVYIILRPEGRLFFNMTVSATVKITYDIMLTEEG